MNKILLSFILLFFSFNWIYSKKLCVFFSKKEIDIPKFYSQIKAIEYDYKKRIWIGSEKNLIIRKAIDINYKYETEKYIELPFSGISDVKEDFNGYVWVCTKNGIYADLKIKKKTFDTSNSTIPDNNITCMDVDSKNRKWFGTSGGIAMFNDSDWTIFNRENTDFPSDSIIDLVFDKNDILWAVTPLCLIKFDGSDWDFFEEEDCEMMPEATCISVDSSCKIYIGTKKGLLCYFDDEWTCYNKANSRLPDNWINTISVDKNNWIYIATKKGLAVLTDNKWFDIEEYNSDNLKNEIYFLRNRELCDPFYTELTVCSKDGIFYYTMENCDYAKCYELIYDIIQDHNFFVYLCEKKPELVTPSYCKNNENYSILGGLWIFTINKYFKPNYSIGFDKKICHHKKQDKVILKHHIKLFGSDNKKLFIDFELLNGKWLLNYFSEYNSLFRGNNPADE